MIEFTVCFIMIALVSPLLGTAIAIGSEGICDIIESIRKKRP